MRKTEQSYTGWWFLLIVFVLTIILFCIWPTAIIPTFNFFLSILIKVIPVFVLIYVLLVVFDYYVEPKKLVDYLDQNSGVRGWFFSIIAGIISTGPIFMWYPLLNELQKHNVRNGFIAAFLYNRAIKPALIPLFIFYFGVAYTIIFTIVMLFASVLNGMTVEYILEKLN